MQFKSERKGKKNNRNKKEIEESERYLHAERIGNGINVNSFKAQAGYGSKQNGEKRRDRKKERESV